MEGLTLLPKTTQPGDPRWCPAQWGPHHQERDRGADTQGLGLARYGRLAGHIRLGNHTWCFLWASMCQALSSDVTQVYSFNYHNYLLGWVLLLAPFCRWQNWGTGGFSNLPKVSPGGKWKTSNSSPECESGYLLLTAVLIGSLWKNGRAKASTAALCFTYGAQRGTVTCPSHPPLLAGEFKWVSVTPSFSEPSCRLGQVTYLFVSLLTHL